jgi:hypothetical protein
MRSALRPELWILRPTSRWRSTYLSPTNPTITLLTTIYPSNRSGSGQRPGRPTGPSLGPLEVPGADRAQAAVDAAVSRFGAIDVLVNNAGYGHLGFFGRDDERGLSGPTIYARRSRATFDSVCIRSFSDPLAEHVALGYSKRLIESYPRGSVWLYRAVTLIDCPGGNVANIDV